MPEGWLAKHGGDRGNQFANLPNGKVGTKTLADFGIGWKQGAAADKLAAISEKDWPEKKAKLLAAHVAIVALAGLLFSLLALPAHAVCTASGSVTSASSEVLPSNDLGSLSAVGGGTPQNRHYLFIQNTGANPMNVAIGSNNNATDEDTLLQPGQAWVMTMTPGASWPDLPGADVAVIAPSGSTTWAACDF
jgi:hypothetical protein